MSYVREIIQDLLNTKVEEKIAFKIHTFLVASQENQHYGIPIESLVEVFEITEENPLINIPLVENYIQGIINIRGEIIPVISLNDILGLSSERSKIKYVIVIERDFKLGLAFYEVKDLYQITFDKIKPIYRIKENEGHRFFSNEFEVEDYIAQILNVEEFYESAFVKG